MKDQYEVRRFEDRVEYIKNGNFHREDGPAVEYDDGSKEWWLNDRRHREDGPAVEYDDGSKEWWLNGIIYTHKQWLEEVSKTVGGYIKNANIDPETAKQIPEL